MEVAEDFPGAGYSSLSAIKYKSVAGGVGEAKVLHIHPLAAIYLSVPSDLYSPPARRRIMGTFQGHRLPSLPFPLPFVVVVGSSACGDL